MNVLHARALIGFGIAGAAIGATGRAVAGDADSRSTNLVGGTLLGVGGVGSVLGVSYGLTGRIPRLGAVGVGAATLSMSALFGAAVTDGVLGGSAGQPPPTLTS